MNYRYDPLDKRCKSLSGAVGRGSEVTFRIFTDGDGESECSVRFHRDDGYSFSAPMKRIPEGFELTLRFGAVGLYFYEFCIGTGRYLGRGPLRRAVVTEEPASWQLTVFDEHYRTPDWFKGGVLYQIFPDRFYKKGDLPIRPYKILRKDWGGQPSFRPNEFGKILNRDFFGGNLAGIEEKLDYLRELHVTAVYLNPIFEAYSNHRYDTGDYMQVDDLLGTVEDFEHLVKEAGKRGIRIILDGVFNHTGDDSRYFNKFGRYDSVGAYQSPSSPYADWYSFHRFPDTYDSWWGIETLPAVNERSKSYHDFILGEGGVVKTWLERGASGYRLDVADEIPDFFLKDLRNSVKKADENAIIIGEVWEDASNKISYDVRREYLQGYELDSVMNYPLKNAIIRFVRTGDVGELRETAAMLLDNYPKETLDCLMNILGTHDTPRILTVLGGRELSDKEEMAKTTLTPEERKSAVEKGKACALLEFTFFGVPCIYYGDEAGMEGYSDPFCRGCFPWDDIDEELHAFYQKLGEIRTGEFHEIFQKGFFRECYAAMDLYVFERYLNDRSLIVYCNTGTMEYRMKAEEGSYRELLSGEVFGNEIPIRAHSFGILARNTILCQT